MIAAPEVKAAFDNLPAPPIISVDAFNTLKAGTDAGRYAMPVAKVERYQLDIVPVPQTFDNRAGGAGANIQITAGAMVLTPLVDMTLSSYTQIIRRFPAPTAVTVDVRQGAGFGGAIVETSNTLNIADTNFNQRTFTFPGNAVLAAGQPYTLHTHENSSLPFVFTQQANTGVPGLSAVGAPGIFGRIVGASVASAQQFTVSTYTDGTNRLALAVDETDHTAIQDVTAGIPAGWTVAPTSNAVLDEVVVGDPGAPAFENGWSNLSGAFTSARFRKYPDGFTIIAGLVTGGPVSQTLPIFTLPEGYRPLGRVVVPSVAQNAFAELRIQEDGKVIPYGGTAGWRSIECMFLGGA
ncbi:MAG: hypothetical protein ACR2RB_05040 [Gammaproteobacteria bacterium]